MEEWRKGGGIDRNREGRGRDDGRNQGRRGGMTEGIRGRGADGRWLWVGMGEAVEAEKGEGRGSAIKGRGKFARKRTHGKVSFDKKSSNDESSSLTNYPLHMTL